MKGQNPKITIASFPSRRLLIQSLLDKVFWRFTVLILNRKIPGAYVRMCVCTVIDDSLMSKSAYWFLLAKRLKQIPSNL